MTRMPMMLLLLLSLLTPQILARATRSTSVTETIPMNEYTTNTGNLEWLTVTVPTDSDIILTTEDGLEMSTHLSEDENPTTEDSLRVKLQQEKDERHQLNPSTEEPKVMFNLISNNFTTEQTIESSTERLPKHALNKYNPAEDSVVEIEKLDTYMKAATFLPDMTTHQSINNDATFSTENSAGENIETTNWPPQEVESNSFRSNSFESISPSTDSANLAGNTWLPNIGDSVESTTEINMEHFMTTFMTDPESKLVDTGSNNNRHIEDPLMNLLSMMSLNAFTEMAKLESEAELYSPEENKVELTTISAPPESSSVAPMPETTSAPPPKEQPNLQLTAESTTQIMEPVPETTIASPRELSFLESIILSPRASETTTQSTTTSTTTEEVPIPTSSSTTTDEIPLASSSSTTTEDTLIPTREKIPLASSSSTTTEQILLASSSSTTTEEIPLPTTTTTTEEIPLASSSSTTTEEVPIPTSSSTTTEETIIPTREEILLASSSSTTTEEIPIPTSSSTTTEDIPIPTSSSTTTEEIPLASSSSTTTEEIPLPTTSTTTKSTPIPTTSSTTSESIPIPSTSSTTTETVLMSTTSSTTTESIPITTTTTTESAPISTTTEVRLQATRAPRIERIFNSDGVEVLYGYSSVVRTNRL